jgi:DNA-binding FadR family transcriptional regulator
MPSSKNTEEVSAFPGITPIRAQATYELVVAQIRRALMLHRFGPGDLLPPERTLAQQLGVSRTVVREAIRVLEGEGLLHVTRGASGGSRVLPAAGEQHLSPAELRSQQAEIEQVMDFRLAVECAAARGAALKRTNDEAAVIHELITRQEALLADAADRKKADQGDVATRFADLDNQFHLAIAAASHNHYLEEAVVTGRINMRRPVGTIFASATNDVNYQHRDIADAILASDADAAQQAMANHIESTRATTQGQLKGGRAKR